jgi:hypothetical protein
VPFPSLGFDLLGEIDFFAAPGATLWIGFLYSFTGYVLSYGLDVHRRYRPDIVISGLRGQSSHATCKSITLWTEIFSITTTAVYIIVMSGAVRTIQGLLATS